MGKKMLINRILSVLLSMVFLIDFFSCEKVDLETIEEKMEDQVFLNMRQNTKSINDIDTTLNVSSDGFVYFEPYVIKNCGCVPSVTVEIITGALVFKFPLASMYSCPLFHISFTANGYSEEANIFTTDGMYVTNKRVGYGQSCEGSVTLTCLNQASPCNQQCSHTTYFSLREGDIVTPNPSGCGRSYGEVTVEVTQTGVAQINVAEPSITFNEMQATRCELYYENRSIYGINLKVGKNSIQFPNGGYWLKMYNDKGECQSITNHYLKCSLWGAPGPKYVEEINNKH